MQKAIEADKEIEKIDRGTEDITQDWNDVCTRWYKLVETLKVPKKSKSKSSHSHPINIIIIQ